jgi:hypothetical protein
MHCSLLHYAVPRQTPAYTEATGDMLLRNIHNVQLRPATQAVQDTREPIRL